MINVILYFLSIIVFNKSKIKINTSTEHVYTPRMQNTWFKHDGGNERLTYVSSYMLACLVCPSFVCL